MYEPLKEDELWNHLKVLFIAHTWLIEETVSLLLLLDVFPDSSFILLR
jgi:hypothetical protein